MLDNQFNKKISLNISFQQLLTRFLAENHFLHLCVEIYIYMFKFNIFKFKYMIFRNKIICMNQGF